MCHDRPVNDDLVFERPARCRPLCSRGTLRAKEAPIEKHLLEFFVFAIGTLGLWMFIDLVILFRLFSRRVDGVVVEVARRRGHSQGNRELFASVVEFESERGSHRFTNDIWTSKPSHEPGERVPVEFLPGYEAHARIPGLSRMAMGTIFCAMGIFAAVMVTRRFDGLSIPAATLAGLLNVVVAVKIAGRYLGEPPAEEASETAADGPANDEPAQQESSPTS